MNKIALAPTSLATTPPLEYVKAAAAAGFDGVGIRLHEGRQTGFPTPVGNKPLLKEIRQVLDDTGLEAVDVLSFYLEPAVDQATFPPVFEAAAELGAKYLLTIGDDPDWSRMRDSFGLCCDQAAQFGLTVTVEFVVMRTLHSLPLAMKIIAEAGRGNAVLCLDPVNCVRGGGTPAQIASTGAKWFPYTQLTDGIVNAGEPDPARLGKMPNNERTLLGQGMIDLHGILDALPEDIPLSVEIPQELSTKLPGQDGRMMTPTAWASFLVKHTKDFMNGYYAAKNRSE